MYLPKASQNDLYEQLNIHEMVQSAMEGYHATIFVYGQTGSGKTYTMEGYEYKVGEDPTNHVC